MGRKWKAGLAGAAAMLGTAVIAAPAGAAAPQAFQGTITIDVTSNDPGVATFTGAISGTGVDITTSDAISGRSAVTHDFDALVLDNGTIQVKDTGRDTGTFDPTTCTGTIGEEGTFTIVGGTGAYEGIKGHGTFSVAGEIVFAPDGNGGCDFESGPLSGAAVVTINGVAQL